MKTTVINVLNRKFMARLNIEAPLWVWFVLFWGLTFVFSLGCFGLYRAFNG